MAICVIAENPKGDAETYGKVMRQVAESGRLPPAGVISQVAGRASRAGA